MKKITYAFAIITMLVCCSFLISCTADEINDDSKNQIIFNISPDFDQILFSDRPK